VITYARDGATFPALRTEILRRAAAVPGQLSHNRGGWRSTEDVFEWPLDDARLLREHVTRVLADVNAALPVPRTRPFKLRAWAIVNRDGSYHSRHSHGGEAAWTGVVYLDGAPDSARTLFEVTPEPVYVAPEPGLIVIFPSTLWHSVEVHRGLEPRVTIAFDAH
jgi:hypothetical protein